MSLEPDADFFIAHKIPGLCEDTLVSGSLADCDKVVGYEAVYRVCFSMTCFFAVLCVLMIYVKSSKDPRSAIQNGYLWTQLFDNPWSYAV